MGDQMLLQTKDCEIRPMIFTLFLSFCVPTIS